MLEGVRVYISWFLGRLVLDFGVTGFREVGVGFGEVGVLVGE